MDVKLYFLREMKEQGLIKVIWIPTKDNSADMFTKNLAGPIFHKHLVAYCGEDAYGCDESKGRVSEAKVGARRTRTGMHNDLDGKETILPDQTASGPNVTMPNMAYKK